MKWITRLSAQPEAQKGFYMETAYRYPLHPGAPGVSFKPEGMAPLTDLFVKSNITTAPKRVTRAHRGAMRNSILAMIGTPGGYGRIAGDRPVREVSA